MWPNHRDRSQKISGFLALSVLVHFGIVAGILYYNLAGPKALPTSPIEAGVGALEVIELPKADPLASADPSGEVKPQPIKDVSDVKEFMTQTDGEVVLPTQDVKKPEPNKQAKKKPVAQKKPIKKAPPKKLPKKLPAKKVAAKKKSNKIPTQLPGRNTVNKSKANTPNLAAVVVPDSDVAATSAQSINPSNKAPSTQTASSFEEELDQGLDGIEGSMDDLNDPELQKALDELNASESVDSYDEDPAVDALEKDLNALLDDKPTQNRKPVALPKTKPKAKPAPKKAVVAKGPRIKGPKVAKPGSLSGVRKADSLKQYPGNRPPAYPQRDRLKRRQGSVTVVAYVTPQGRTKNIKVVQSSGTNRMNASAQRAFSKYRFYPGQQGLVRQTYVFRLSGDTQDIPARLGSR